MSEGLAQGPYAAARVEFEPVTLQTQGTEPATEPPYPTHILFPCAHALGMVHLLLEKPFVVHLCSYYCYSLPSVIFSLILWPINSSLAQQRMNFYNFTFYSNLSFRSARGRIDLMV